MKSQDLMAAVRVAIPGRSWSYPELAAALEMSASEAHAAIKRGIACGLVDATTRTARNSSLLEFLLCGLKYVFPPVWVGITRGVPTAHAASVLKSSFVDDELPPVWPHEEGGTRGRGLVPIYKSVPAAALRDPVFHEWMALIDAVRAGRAREREIAARLLRERLT
jgi:hypothetical protein